MESSSDQITLLQWSSKVAIILQSGIPEPFAFSREVVVLSFYISSLSHVCKWTEAGWVNITLEEAIRENPYGTVSAKSGLFMCSLCRQYVGLSDGYINRRYFFHDHNSRDCPDKKFSNSFEYPVHFATDFSLPVRVHNVDNENISFEIGLTCLPPDLFQDLQTSVITIMPVNFTYNLSDRLKPDCTTYLSVGNVPQNSYRISVSGPTADDLLMYWPGTIDGILESGTLFDADSNKLLRPGSEVLPHKKYYLITTKYACVLLDIKCTKVNELNTNQDGKLRYWKIYEVEALEFSHWAARFFLEYGYLLTASPASIHPIWPPYFQRTIITNYYGDSVFLHVTGDSKTMYYPWVYDDKEESINSDEKLIEVSCNGRQQLISVGGTSILSYMYFWKDTPIEPGCMPQISITTVNGISVNAGLIDVLPDKGILQISCPFDGTAVLMNGQAVVTKIDFSADQIMEIDHIRFGSQIRIFVGLDCLWSASFQSSNTGNCSSSESLLPQLKNARGIQVPAPHALGSIVPLFEDDPQVKRWLYYTIRTGKISSGALSILKNFVALHFHVKGDMPWNY